MIQPGLLQKLRCPLTREPVTLAKQQLVDTLNSELRAGRLFNQLGVQLEEEIVEGLVNESMSCFIMVRHGIPELIPDQTIPLDHLELFEPC